MFFGSRERRVYGGIVIFNDFVIFSSNTGSLEKVSRYYHKREPGGAYPLPLPPPVVASYAAQMLSSTN